MNSTEISLEDFVSFQRGFDLPKKDFIEGDYPVVGSTSILGYHNVYKVKGPGLVTGRSGTLGNFQYIVSDFWPHNTTLWVKNFKGNNSRFFYYYLLTINLAKFNSGGAVPTLNRNLIKNYRVKKFSLEKQQKIVSILSSYDDLIENNLKRIKLLEESAQMIYKEQFGDFLLSDDSIKQLPKGFSIKLLGEISAKLESGSRPKGGIDKKLRSGVPSIGAENVIGLGKYNYQAEKMIPESFFAKMKNGVIEDRDILIYKDGAYIGKTSLFQDDFPYTKCCVNEHVFLIHCSNRLYQYFLFLTLNHPLYYKKMQNLNANSAQPGINQVAVKSLSLIWPDEKTIISFNHKIESMISLIFNLAKQNRLLQQARDLLLPKLMTGEIEV